MTLPIFPALPGIAFPGTRSARFNTDLSESVTGVRTPTRNQLEPRWLYDLPVEFLRDRTGFTEFSDLLNLYLSCYGRFGTFLYSDPRDNTATNQSFGVGDGSTTQFFLVRTAFGFTQRVAALNGTPTIQVSGINAIGATINAYGVVTFGTPPAPNAVLTWSGLYYWICRFSEDQLDLSQFADRWWEVKSLKFETEIIAS